MPKASLSSLPDDLLLDIVERLDTARDVSHLGRLARRSHRLVETAGWRTFVKTRFPSLHVPTATATAAAGGGVQPGADEPPWGLLANRFTYLDRCWDKRAIRFHVFRTQPPPPPPPYPPVRRHREPRPAKQAVDFHGIVDAHHVSCLDQEVVAWGAGEDVHVRWCTGEGTKSKPSWGSALGRHTNYAAGTGDVTALKIIERAPGTPDIVVGRANGHVQILSAADDSSFGTSLTEPLTLDTRGDQHRMSALTISPGRLAVSCAEWRPDTGILATCRSSHLHLCNVPPERDASLGALAFHDMSPDRPPHQESMIRDIKFLDNDHLAVALGSSSQPIQYGTIRPSGVVFEPTPGRRRGDGL